MMPASPDPIETIDIGILLKVLWKSKLLLGTIFLGTGIVAFLVCLTLKPQYQAQATLIIPQKTSGPSVFSMLQSQVGAMGASSLGLKNPNDVYLKMLKSRTVADRLIKRFALKTLFHTRSDQAARARLTSRLSVKLDKADIIEVSFVDGDPVRAATILNAYVEELNAVNQSLALTDASQKRAFLEAQVTQVKHKLREAENQLQAFQESHSMFSIQDQATSLATSIAKLKGEISLAQVQLGVLKTYTTEKNNERQLLESQIKAMRGELAKFESAFRTKAPAVSSGGISELGKDYLRLMREFKEQESLYGVLVQQLEAAKLDESKSATVVQVLDPAIPPEFPFKPHKIRLILGTACLSTFLAAAGIVMRALYRGKEQ